MRKLSIGRVLQTTAFSFGMTALVLSVACAPSKTKSVPLTKAAVDRFMDTATQGAQKAFPKFQCTSADTVEFSSRIQGASAEVVSREAMDPAAAGNAAAFDVMVKIMITGLDKNVYQLIARGVVGNDGKASGLLVDPTGYDSHPETIYNFEGSCLMFNNQCKTLFVHVIENVAAIPSAATLAAPVTSPSPSPDVKKADAGDLPDSGTVADSAQSVVQNAPVVLVPPSPSAVTAKRHETVIAFHITNAPAAPTQSPSPSPVAIEAVSNSTTSPAANTASPSNSQLMEMVWKPGTPARGACTPSSATNSFDRAINGLPPTSPFRTAPPVKAQDPADDSTADPKTPAKGSLKDQPVEDIGDGSDGKGSTLSNDGAPAPKVPVETTAPVQASAPVQAPAPASGPADIPAQDQAIKADASRVNSK